METKVAKWKQKIRTFETLNKNDCIIVSISYNTIFSLKVAKWKQFQNIVIK